MKTKQQYYTENRYYVAHSIALVILIACAIHLGQNGFSWGWLGVTLIPIAVFVASYFSLNVAYARYVQQEIDKTNWASTRTDMINTEEDD
jgi:uncharacterized membrane protein YdbT with pleckstrin-like domain